MVDNKRKDVIEKYITLTEKILKNSNDARFYGTDVEIYRSEIHIINIIGNNSDMHISEIARKFGVTKGAISKTIKKLEKKGLVEKIIDVNNNTRTLVKLTEKGTIAYLAHEQYHNQYDKDMYLYLESLKLKDLEILDTFLEKANEMAERHI
ncbi:MarR family transcriptional regulator [Clostridiaceae bacterium M8S5]|nr:MarR family transcriptional regulator [Clostridiaceae bacterium M8S5]